nr:hypothetical protein A5881_002838 [Enterococcus termitis]
MFDDLLGGIGIIKFKKITKAAVLLPLLIFIATFIYGLLKFDFSGNTPNQPYGLIYSFVVLQFVFIGYIFSFVVNAVVVVFFLKKFNQKSQQVQRLISIYITSWLLLLILFFKFGYSALFPYSTLFAPGTIGVGLMVLFVAVSGWLVVDRSTGFTHDQRERVRVKTVIFGVTLPVLLIILTVGTRLGFLAYAQNNRNDEYQQVIEQKLHSVGTKGQVKIVKAYDSSKSKHVQLNYTVTQDGVSVSAKGALRRKNTTDKWKLVDSSLTTYDNSIQTILQVPAHSQEAKTFLNEFTEEVEKSITKSGLTKEIGTNMPLEKNETRTDHDLPYLAFNNEGSNEKIKQWAKENSQSTNKKEAAFGGYAALTVKQLMKSHMIIANVPIQYPYVEESDFDERTENAEKYRDQVIKNLDYSKLMDGYYEIQVGSSGNPRLFLVKNHQMSEVKGLLSSSLLREPSEDVGSFGFDYMEW